MNRRRSCLSLHCRSFGNSRRAVRWCCSRIIGTSCGSTPTRHRSASGIRQSGSGSGVSGGDERPLWRRRSARGEGVAFGGAYEGAGIGDCRGPHLLTRDVLPCRRSQPSSASLPGAFASADFAGGTSASGGRRSGSAAGGTSVARAAEAEEKAETAPAPQGKQGTVAHCTAAGCGRKADSAHKCALASD